MLRDAIKGHGRSKTKLVLSDVLERLKLKLQRKNLFLISLSEFLPTLEGFISLCALNSRVTLVCVQTTQLARHT